MKHSEVIVDIPADVVRSIMIRIQFGATNECWPIHDKQRGYGTIAFSGHRYPAHRVVYKLFTGIDPMDKIVCHRCDYKPCVNPHHVYLGTSATNSDDVVRRNSQRGRVANVINRTHLHPDFATASQAERDLAGAK